MILKYYTIHNINLIRLDLVWPLIENDVITFKPLSIGQLLATLTSKVSETCSWNSVATTNKADKKT